MHRCPCCSYKTLYERGGYEVCKVCFWEDDGQSDHDADAAIARRVVVGICNMELEKLIASIESESEPEQGFFWMIRQGIFDKGAFNRAREPWPPEKAKWAIPASVTQLLER